ncbi:MAG TPA: hypothetical protein VFS02_11115 [Telluria sp.]|nr:hypothetical protein [Telluria sp.]
MACCGSSRQQVARRDFGAGAVSGQGEPAARAAVPGSGVVFAYYGASELVVIGSVSGRRYRFAERGARLQVDARDAPALEAHTRLRRLST